MMKRRNTPARAAVLALLEDSKQAMSQDMIEDQLSIEADRVTIYRMLNRLCEDGIAHKVVAEDGKSYFALCHTCEAHHHVHDHFHFKCESCGQIECLVHEVDVKLPKGYKALSMNCIVNGLCEKCNVQ